MSEGEWIKCPACGWHWKRLHTGHHKLEHKEGLASKGEFTFNKGNLEEDALISIRNLPGGRGNPESFKEIERITLKEATRLPEYEDLTTSLRNKCKQILVSLEEE